MMAMVVMVVGWLVEARAQPGAAELGAVDWAEKWVGLSLI
jgi:hypothetical protein